MPLRCKDVRDVHSINTCVCVCVCVCACVHVHTQGSKLETKLDPSGHGISMGAGFYFDFLATLHLHIYTGTIWQLCMSACVSMCTRTYHKHMIVPTLTEGYTRAHIYAPTRKYSRTNVSIKHAFARKHPIPPTHVHSAHDTAYLHTHMQTVANQNYMGSINTQMSLNGGLCWGVGGWMDGCVCDTPCIVIHNALLWRVTDRLGVVSSECDMAHHYLRKDSFMCVK